MTKTLRITDLPSTAPTSFAFVPNAEELSEIARALGILSVKKLRLEGEITPQGQDDWHLHAKLGATVSQACVATLEPVTTRIDEALSRTYLANWTEPEEAELELDDGDDSDPLPDLLDLTELAREALALALPLNPRSPSADQIDTVYGPEGTDAMTDEAAKPFAGLADLKKKLEGEA